MLASAAPRRLLLALPQSLFDLGSGAAVSMRLMACQLASSGWQVQAVCTSATESGRLGLPPVGSFGGSWGIGTAQAEGVGAGVLGPFTTLRGSAGSVGALPAEAFGAG